MNIKYYTVSILGLLGILACGCRQDKKDDQIVSQKFIHKYGYAVSKEEWEERNYPGQVITAMRNGSMVTATYENGVLHGPCTHTFPNSQTVEIYYLYNFGEVAKEIIYDVRGMPVREMVQLSPTRYSLTLWYAEGTPMSIEEFAGDELLEGQYLTLNNETEARVEKGNGKRIRRDLHGLLLSKDEIAKGYVVKHEAFHPNGAPESIAYFNNKQLHGEKRLFSASGEPLVIEEWVHGQLHGKSTFFKNGTKTLEISYLNGSREGPEIHYVDGEKISQEIAWENNKKHGPALYYIDGSTETEWYYEGALVSKEKYDELSYLDSKIAQINPSYKVDTVRTK